MKFQCDRCKTRYSIGEDKIRGKVLKIRCKNCSAVITVREGSGAVTEKSQVAASPAAANGAARKPASGAAAAAVPASPALEDAFNRAMSRLPTPSPAKDGGGRSDTENEEGGGEGDGDSTKMAPAPAMGGLDIEWFVSIEGEQEGPFTLSEAQQRVSHRQPTEEMFAWQEGFDDWLLVEQVPELAPHLPKPAAARARPTAPPIPSDAGFRAPSASPLAASAISMASSAASGASAAVAKAKAAPVPLPAAAPESAGGSLSLAALAASTTSTESNDAGASDGDNMDFEIGEASRVVKMPMLVPPPGGFAGGARAAGASGAMPGMASGSVLGRGTGGLSVSGGVLPADANMAAALLVPTRRAKHGVVFFVGFGALAAIAVVMVILLVRGSSNARGDDLSQSPASLFIEDYYNTAPELMQLPNAPKAPADEQGDKNPEKVIKRPGQGKPKNPGLGGQNPGGNGTKPGGGDELDLTEPSAGDLRDRDAEEVLQARQRYQGLLQQCWERALKLNPDLKRAGVRFDVQLTITAAGRVNGVTVNGGGAEKDLRDCVRQRVGGWGFGPAKADFTTQVTLVFN